MKKLFCIAGEPSGDKLCGTLLNKLKGIEPHLELQGIGGKEMKEQGVDCVISISKTAFMGGVEVLKKAFLVRKNLIKTKESILSFKPNCVLLVDYSGFNMIIASFCKKRSIPVIYYVSPKFWSWGEWRVKRFKKNVDLLLSILPFEKEFFKKHGFENVEYVGNPWYSIIKEKKNKEKSIFRRE